METREQFEARIWGEHGDEMEAIVNCLAEIAWQLMLANELKRYSNAYGKSDFKRIRHEGF